MVQYMHI